MRTDKEILEQTNKLANKFAGILGYESRAKEYEFYKSANHVAILCWDMACEAQLVLTQTDVKGNIE